MLKAAVKAGKLANGWERGKGSVLHLIETEHPDLYMQKALCGAQPAIQWTERDVDLSKCCPKCLKKLSGVGK